MSTLPSIPADGLKVRDLDADTQAAIQSSLRSSAALHEFLELTIEELGHTYAVLSLPLATNALNTSRNLHGGAVAALIDVAAGAAAARSENYDAAQQSLVTADLHVRYLRTPRGERVFARAEVLKPGKQLVVLECKVTDSADQLVASADFSMMIVPRRGPAR